MSGRWCPCRLALLYTGSSGDSGNSAFRDSGAVMIANGTVLVAPVDPYNLDQSLVYDPVANAWSGGPYYLHGQDEATCKWKLPDDSILTVDGQHAPLQNVYLPASNTWLADNDIPEPLYDTYGGELGPALLLPNGNAIFFGATNHTAIYTPTGTNTAGSWVAGPDFPNSQGMPDAPAAMMIDGKILCTTEIDVATNSGEWYAPVKASMNMTTWPTPSRRCLRPAAAPLSTTFCWPSLMLDLPDGTVLWGHRQSDFYVYQPDGVPLAAGKPVINSITTNSDGSLLLTGTLFNGLCQGRLLW